MDMDAIDTIDTMDMMEKRTWKQYGIIGSLRASGRAGSFFVIVKQRAEISPVMVLLPLAWALSGGVPRLRWRRTGEE
ncbi:hypothetical protein [Paenibacillus sp. GCM10023250]|uniref:hypothetical protein n=1 Tax=Paenibacillus sp. GCM10023250 TaxID=3252648 RepID=UPI0036140C5C